MLAAGAVAPGQQRQGTAANQPAFFASATTARPGGTVGSLAVRLPLYAAGNIVVVNLCGNFLTTSDTATAAGWTLDGTAASGQRILFGFHRIMNGSEGSTVTFTFNNSFEQPFALAATYVGTTGTDGTPATNTLPTTPTWTCGPVTTTGSSRLMVALSFGEGTDYGALTAGTRRLDVIDGGEAAIIADMAAPVAGPYSMGGALTSSFATHSVLIALKP